MFFKLIACNLYRTIKSPFFWISVITVCMICFASYAYNDPVTEDKMMVFELIGNKELVSNDPRLSSFEIFKNVNGLGLIVFLPVIVSVPFASLHLDEMNSGMGRFMLQRQSKRKYFIGSGITSFISGGLICLIAYALYGLTVYFAFPSIVSYSEEKTAFLRLHYEGVTEPFKKVIDSGEYALPVFLLLLQMFLLGGIVSMFSLLFSAFIKNIYIVVCLPCFIFYAWYYFTVFVVEKNADGKIKLPKPVMDFIYYSPSSMLTECFLYPKMGSKILIVQVAICVVLFMGYYFGCILL